MGIYLTKAQRHYSETAETVTTRYLESLLTLYGTITKNFTNGTGKKTFRATNLHYIELIEDLIYDSIEIIEEENGEISVFFYKYQISSMESAFKKGLQEMIGDKRLRIEDSIRNHERIRGWVS